jgi:hypothetical protein
MFEIISKLAGKVIDIARDKLKEDEEFKRLRSAVVEKMDRELRFNDEILKETVRHKKNDETLIDGLIETLNTDSFDELVKSSVPLSLIFENLELNINHWEDFYKSTKLSNKNMLQWSENIASQVFLIERIYHRIKILKNLRKISIHRGSESVRYIRFLISAYRFFEKMN